jgi:pre-mRNA-processing factor 17
MLAKTTDTSKSISYNIPYADLSRPVAGPVNPFKAKDGNALKRKNVLTGYAEEAVVSDATFRTQHRTFQSRGYAIDPSANGHIIGDVANAQRLEGRDVVQMRPSKEASEAFRRKRQRKGDPSIVDGEGAYLGPWARYDDTDQAYEDEAAMAGEELASDEEYIDESVVPERAPAMDKAATSYEDDVSNAETTEFHGSELFDYQGRSYMHVPLDLDIDLRKEPGSERNYHPKKQIFKWKFGTKPITSLRFFPNSGHLLLSASADAKIKLYSVYNQRELLRSFSGHSKSVSDISFNDRGTSFLSGSYDRKMVLWDTETGKAVSRYNTGKIPHVIKFHPDESSHEFLAGMSDNRIVQFDTRSGEMTQEYNHHLASINSKPHANFRIFTLILIYLSYYICRFQSPHGHDFRR